MADPVLNRQRLAFRGGIGKRRRRRPGNVGHFIGAPSGMDENMAADILRNVEYGGQAVGVFAFFAFGDAEEITEASAIDEEGGHAFDVGFLGEEHAADFGVFDDGNLWGFGILAGDVAALEAAAGVFDGVLVGVGGLGDGLDAGVDARGVHELEHVAEAFVFFAE